MSQVRDGTEKPRAVVHRRILDVAEDRPEASLADIAAEVSGATPDLVDRVLGEYGDPTEEEPMSQNGTSAPETVTDEPDDDSADATLPTDLTEKQLETVSAVHEQPSASQGEIADRLGVSRATVSRRLNDIPGFEWADRETLTSNLFDSTDLTPTVLADDTATDRSDDADARADDAEQSESAAEDAAVDHLEDRLDAVEGRLDDVAGGDATGEAGPGLRPELAQKVVHAAMDSDRITEDEELELLEALLDW